LISPLFFLYLALFAARSLLPVIFLRVTEHVVKQKIRYSDKLLKFVSSGVYQIWSFLSLIQFDSL
jgi:hypothetical protein